MYIDYKHSPVEQNITNSPELRDGYFVDNTGNLWQMDISTRVYTQTSVSGLDNYSFVAEETNIGQYIYGTRGGNLVEIDKSDFSEQNVVAIPSGWDFKTITSGHTGGIFIGSQKHQRNEFKIQKYDPVSKTVEREKNYSVVRHSSTRERYFYTINLFIQDDDYIYTTISNRDLYTDRGYFIKLNKDTGVETLYQNNGFGTGDAVFDGTYRWVSSANNRSTQGKIYQLDSNLNFIQETNLGTRGGGGSFYNYDWYNGNIIANGHNPSGSYDGGISFYNKSTDTLDNYTGISSGQMSTTYFTKHNIALFPRGGNNTAGTDIYNLDTHARLHRRSNWFSTYIIDPYGGERMSGRDNSSEYGTLDSSGNRSTAENEGIIRDVRKHTQITPYL